MKKIRFIRAANNESDNIAGWLELADFSGTVTVVYNAGTTREQIEANAKELVRRWNAFEEDGIVDELREVCKRLLVERINIGRDKPFWTPGNIELLEAAIAKVS